MNELKNNTLQVVRYKNGTYYCKTRGESLTLHNMYIYMVRDDYDIVVYSEKINGVDITNNVLGRCLASYYLQGSFSTEFLVEEIKRSR